ncbi:hypothetical protein INT48_006646 [Thamnidium elegans]|uniref:Uncharacterized protein n=1 Tax=Thamnidium elegans TaxID=101142 RepID=A0A8H7SXX6_9FUNG|nr:hypothetical protein INT48_006646 [Thamnidium elegans]
MSNFRISKAAYTDDTLIEVALACSNTTVGPNKYQLFCATLSDLAGSCVKLPSRLTAAGELDCVEVTSQAYLQNLYDTTGMACAVNCYYPLSFPSYSYIYPTRTYEYPSITYSPPTVPTPTPNTKDIIPTFLAPNNNGGAEGGASMMDPNFLFTFMAVFAVMLLCVRRAI